MSTIKIIPITDQYRANYERIFNKVGRPVSRKEALRISKRILKTAERERRNNTPDASVSSVPPSLRDASAPAGVTYNPNPESVLISGNPFSDHWIGWVL